MSAPARHLHVVDAETGELVDGCPGCRERDDVIDRVQVDLDNTTTKLRAAWRQIRNLQGERERQHREHERRAEVEALFELWQERCRHPKARLDVGPGSRFERILWGLETYDYETCVLAIEGAAYDPFVTRGKGGRPQRNDHIGLIFRNAEKFESFANRGAWARKQAAA